MRRIIAPLISVLSIAGIAVGSARATDGAVPANTTFEGSDAIRTVPDIDGDELSDVDEVNTGTMFWTEQRTRGVIKTANRDGSEVMTVVSQVSGAAEIALDIEGGKMYWAAFNFTSPGTVERANLDGTDREVLVDDVNAFGVALDHAAQKLYWTEFTFFGNSPGALFRSNLDGSSIEFLLEGRKPRSITLDVASGKMYWTSNPTQGESGPGKIKRANLDGGGEEDVVVLPLGFGGIALDLDAGKMYWTHQRQIRRANLDGSEIEELIEFEGLVSVAGIAVDSGAGKMYWTFYDFGVGPSKIQRANLDGSGIEDLVTEGIGQPVGIALYFSEPPFPTPDGETPAAEDICTLWGFTGTINGLCNAYCEAMDCDDAEPKASEQACTRVLGKIETALGETPFPTCEDADDDGVPDGLDNCPDDPNVDQADEYPSTPEGDACERFGCLCAAQWENETGAWDIRTLGDLACSASSHPTSVSAGFPVFPPGGGSRPLSAFLYQLSAGAFFPGTGSCFDALAFDRGGISERITIERAVLPGDLTACRMYLSNQGCDFGD